jgi:serine/threonine-protein phosphatase 2A activator
VKPKAISDPEMAEMLKKDYHFFACLAYIHQVKSGPFHEHSNQLWNISGVPNWAKVFTGKPVLSLFYFYVTVLDLCHLI